MNRSYTPLLALTALLALAACGDDDSALRADLCAQTTGAEHSRCACEVDILLDELSGSDKEMMARMLLIRGQGLTGPAARSALLKDYDADDIDAFAEAAAAPMRHAAAVCRD